jgi:hypothetical protein
LSDISTSAPARDTQDDLFVGIGSLPAARLDALLAQPAGRVVLAEPDPDRAVRIEAEHAGRAGLQVIAAAVAQAAGPAELSLYNQPGLQSLRPPTEALRQLLPGLRPRRCLAVERITPAGLLESLGAAAGRIRLWVDALGEEAAILAGWEAAGALERVSRLQLRCGSRPLFEGAWDAATLQEWLRLRGFVALPAEEDDPDWPELVFVPDPLVQRLKAELQRLGETGARLAAREARVAELEARLAELTESDKAQAAQLAQQKAAAQAAEERAGGFETELKAKTARAGELEARLAELTESGKAQAAQLAQQKAATQAVEERAGRLEAELKAKTARVAELEASLDKLQGNLAVALRMQNLAQLDLQELRQRYRDVETARAAQAELLQKLAPRLQQAARQLQLLTRLEEEQPAPARPSAELLEEPGEAVRPKARRKAKAAAKQKPKRNREAG